MQCWNNRVLNRHLSNLKTKQRYQPYLLDYCLRQAKDRKKSLEEIFDLNNQLPH